MGSRFPLPARRNTTQPSQSDFCLWNMSSHEMRLDPEAVLPSLKPN
jgi:hypothetical protein